MITAKNAEGFDDDQLKMQYKDIWREKNQLSGIIMRAAKEKADYEQAHAMFLKDQVCLCRCICICIHICVYIHI